MHRIKCSENKVNYSRVFFFFFSCLFKNQISVEFLEEPVLRLLGGVFQSHCLHNLFRMQLSLPFTSASGTKYFCKSLL